MPRFSILYASSLKVGIDQLLSETITGFRMLKSLVIIKDSENVLIETIIVLIYRPIRTIYHFRVVNKTVKPTIFPSQDVIINHEHFAHQKAAHLPERLFEHHSIVTVLE